MIKSRQIIAILLVLFFLPGGSFSWAAGKSKIVVMLGDSTTRSARSRPGQKLTDYVQSDFTKDKSGNVLVINSGVGGDTVRRAYQRLEEDVFSKNPDVVTISFGLNDIWKLSPDEFCKWLKKCRRYSRENAGKNFAYNQHSVW